MEAATEPAPAVGATGTPEVKMLKPSDLTKAELLQVVEMLAMKTGPYYLDRALGRLGSSATTPCRCVEAD